MAAATAGGPRRLGRSRQPASPFLGSLHRIVLQAALGDGEDAASAYREWRRRVVLDDLDWPTYRLLPLLVRAAERHGIVDDETKRIIGAVKHIWLTNTLRLNGLVRAVQALQDASIPSLLLKGAALFARDENKIAQRATGDYDILVRPVDARGAVAALLASGFSSLIFRADRFSETDFDNVHATALLFGEKADAGQVDLHWRPAAEVPLPGLTEFLFAGAQAMRLVGNAVLVPNLPDHLFLGLVHATSSSIDDRVDWFVEAAQIAEGSKDQLDWSRVAHLCRRYRMNAVAAEVFSLLNDCLPGLIPNGEIRRMRRSTGVLERRELRIARRPAADRTPVQRVARRIFWLARSVQEGGSFVGAALRLPFVGTSRRAIVEAVLNELPERFTAIQLRALWRLHQKDETERLHAMAGPDFPTGWSVPEETGRWSDGRLSILRLVSSAPPAKRLNVILRVRAFIPHPTSRIDLALFAGIRLQEVSLGAESAWPAAVVAPTRTGPDGLVVVAMKIKNPISPAEVELSSDTRQLGIFIERVETEAPYA